MTMVKEGNLIPSAQQISARAGVAVRSVFRHFDDMENLHVAFDQLLQEEVEKKFPKESLLLESETPLSERITRVIEIQTSLWELNENIILSAHAQFWNSKALRKNYARYQSSQRKQLDEWLPELKEFDRTSRESANAIVSFEMWNRLRRHQGLGKAQATNVVTSMLNSVFDS
jgi:AcrR family transcriptional regulator